MTHPVVHTEKGYDQSQAPAETANAAPDATPTDAERAAAELKGTGNERSDAPE